MDHRRHSCRDNPLAEELRRSVGFTRGAAIQRGLAKIESPEGMIVAYATQPGRTAEDGTGRNSPYTAAFLRHVEEQEEIGTIFRRISGDVYEATNHTQLPELSLSLIGEFHLRGRPADTSLSEAERAWAAVKDTTTEAVLNDFNKRYGESIFGTLARARLDDIKKSQVALASPPALLSGGAPGERSPAPNPPSDPCASAAADWNQSQGVGTRLAYEDHLARFPNCKFAALAKEQIAAIDLARARIAAQGERSPAATTMVDCASAAEHWRYTEEIRTRLAFEDHLARYPKCKFAGPAMRNLGDLYRDGKGVPKSIADARNWYDRAAAAGDAAAKERLTNLDPSTPPRRQGR